MSKSIIKNGRVVFPSSLRVERAEVIIENGQIARIDLSGNNDDSTAKGSLKSIDASGHYVSPGFIDLQVNGGAGADFLRATTGQLNQFAREWISTGCTSFLGTIITEDVHKMRSAMERLLGAGLPNFAGFHVEGPFISSGHKGTHESRFLEEPDLDELEEIMNGLSDHVRLVTLAPELADAEDLIEYLNELGIVVSIGHSSATFSEAMKGIEEGASSFTHLFNGMSGFHHREPGCVGAALTSDAYTGLIADGLHVHPAAVGLANRLKGPERLYLVTDAISAAGLSEGTYTLGGQEILVDDGIARLADGTISGSTLTMDRAVKNLVEFTNSTLAEAVRSATLTPAELVGVDDRKGSIEVGKEADLVIFDEDLNVDKTIIKGKVVYNNER